MYEEDSVKTINNALQNINTLHGIMQECRFDGIGAHTVFNDTLGYDYCIVLMRDSLKYQLLHSECGNSLDGKEQKLYNNWYIRSVPKY